MLLVPPNSPCRISSSQLIFIFLTSMFPMLFWGWHGSSLWGRCRLISWERRWNSKWLRDPTLFEGFSRLLGKSHSNRCLYCLLILWPMSFTSWFNSRVCRPCLCLQQKSCFRRKYRRKSGRSSRSSEVCLPCPPGCFRNVNLIIGFTYCQTLNPSMFAPTSIRIFKKMKSNVRFEKY